jgi:hypothetical protein
VLDNYVYLPLAGGRTHALDVMIEWWLKSYSRLVYVPIVAAPLADGMRSTDLAFQHAVDERLLEELDRRELQALRLEPGQRDRWLDIVEDAIHSQLDTPQLSLL